MSFEYSVHHEDGKILHVLGSAKLIEQDGELMYQRFLLDYSDQKHEEERRERHQQSLIRALGVSYLVMCSFDLNTGRGELLRISDEADEGLRSIFDGSLTYEQSLFDYVDSRRCPTTVPCYAICSRAIACARSSRIASASTSCTVRSSTG